jgi:predicted DNA binding CopG/RHH family protein
MWFSSLESMYDFLQAHQFSAVKYAEKDSSVTLSLNEIDLIETA